MSQTVPLYKDNVCLPRTKDFQPCSRGFSMDIGGSLLKLAFIADKTDKNNQDGTIKIHLVSFPRDQVEDALAYLEQHYAVPHSKEQPPDVTICGVGGHEYRHKIDEIMHVKTRVVMEMGSFGSALLYLSKHMPLDKLLHQFPADAEETLKKINKEQRKMWGSLNYHDIIHLDDDANSGFFTPPSNIAPCGLYIMGSGAVLVKVETNGTSVSYEYTDRCGKTFLGLGNALTGAKNFEELISLAVSGDVSDVHITAKEMNAGDWDESYSQVDEEMMAYCFGKMVNKDRESVSRSSLARAFLYSLCEELVHIAVLSAQVHKLKHIFVCGHFPNSHPIIREMLMQHFIARAARMSARDKVSMYFLKYGGHLGALGCLLTNLLGPDTDH